MRGNKEMLDTYNHIVGLNNTLGSRHSRTGPLKSTGRPCYHRAIIFNGKSYRSLACIYMHQQIARLILIFIFVLYENTYKANLLY